MENAMTDNDLNTETSSHRPAGVALGKYGGYFEQAVSERTAELKAINEQLQNSIIEYRKTQDDLEQSVEEKERLLRELYHRTKNNMQVICSLLSLQMNTVKDDTILSMLIKTEHRIRSMALVHEKLCRSKNLSRIDIKAYLCDLASNLVKSYHISGEKISLTLNLERIPVTIATAIPCGLIVNELITNALKYAFPDNRKGKIHIELRLNRKDEIELRIADNGIGIPHSFNFNEVDSLGLQLVQNLAIVQLDGKVRWNLGRGLTFHLRFKEQSGPAESGEA